MKKGYALYGTFKYVFLCLIFLYIITSTTNFFTPITPLVALVIVLSGLTIGIFTGRSIQIEFLRTKATHFSTALSIAIFTIWCVLASSRISIGVDSNIYHLPLAILTNHSICYPGIGKLCSHFSFSNGGSVISSLVTAFNIPGIENSFNSIIWMLLGIGLYLYCEKSSTEKYFSVLITGIFLLTPVIFWQSYNLEADLPANVFILFGFLAFYKREIPDAFLFLSFATIFKTVGLFALFFLCVYILIQIARKNSFFRRDLKYVLGILILVVFFTRIFIMSGNPIYPLLSINFINWGISSEFQDSLILRLKNFSGVQRSFSGLGDFLVAFFMNPSKYKSSFWFSPVFIITVISYIILRFHKAFRKTPDFHCLYIGFAIMAIGALWFIGSPLERFIMGVLMFLTLTFSISFFSANILKPLKNLMLISMAGTFLLFSVNAIKHIYRDIIPVAFRPLDRQENLLPFSHEIFVEKRTEEGMEYTVSQSSFCGRHKPPCINTNSVVGEQELTDEYFNANR